jgi:hypothetical protein
MNGMVTLYRRSFALVLALSLFPALAVAAGVQPRLTTLAPVRGIGI